MEAIEIYYYSAQWLQGPINVDDFAKMVARGEIMPETPAWIPTANNWVSADFLVHLSEQSDEQTPDDSNNNHAQYHDLPKPQTMFAACLAQEKNEHPSASGGYKLLKKLGAGGMGITYQARQLSLDRIVALKILLPRYSRDEKFIRRFQHEARAVAKLNHEYIASAYEVGNYRVEYFLAMEFIDGVTLAQALQTHGKIDEKRAVEIIRKIIDALKYAHTLGILHRDISAKNIMLTNDDKPKLIDLGLSKSVGEKKDDGSDSSVALGTPAYMSPEQALGRKEIDIRSDLYSLGCVFYEMLTGAPPFRGASALETISMHLNSDVPEIAKITPALSAVIKKMTQRDRKDRYSTPAELLSALENIHLSVTPTRTEILPISEQLRNGENSETLNLILRNDWREYLHIIAQNIEQRLLATDSPPDFQGYVQTIFAELTANAFDHGVTDDDHGVINLRLELNATFFRLEVEDSGVGFAARETIKTLQQSSPRRERQRGLLQVSHLADLLEFNKKGNKVKAVIYRKSVDSGVEENVRDGITFVEVKGKGDMVLAEEFRRWVDKYAEANTAPLCLMIRTDWVSSMFVGSLAKLSDKMQDKRFAVWVERSACRRIMQQLGITSFIEIHSSFDKAVAAVKT